MLRLPARQQVQGTAFSATAGPDRGMRTGMRSWDAHRGAIVGCAQGCGRGRQSWECRAPRWEGTCYLTWMPCSTQLLTSLNASSKVIIFKANFTHIKIVMNFLSLLNHLIFNEFFRNFILIFIDYVHDFTFFIHFLSAIVEYLLNIFPFIQSFQIY